jgi:hypothetical protein
MDIGGNQIVGLFTFEEVWASFPNWMKPTTKEEKILKEGLEKASENQENTRRISSLAFWNRIGCPPCAGSKPADLIGSFQRG